MMIRVTNIIKMILTIKTVMIMNITMKINTMILRMRKNTTVMIINMIFEMMNIMNTITNVIVMTKDNINII